MRVFKFLPSLIVLLLLLSSIAYCQQLSSEPEVIQACEGKNTGDASQVIGPHGGKVSGICKEVDGKLVLQPDRPQEKSSGTSNSPPPEAYQACIGKIAGDASQVIGPHGGKVNGICKEVDGKLVLQPDGSKGTTGTSSGLPPEAYQACEGKNSGDASQVIGPSGGKVSGICKEVDGKLVLQPDRLKVK